MFCTVCGVEGPTKNVKFYQNIGMLVTRQWTKVEGDLCRPCIRRYFRAYTITTLMIGWWGVVSLIVTPFILLNNIVGYLGAIGLPEPELSATQRSFAFAPPPGPGSLKLPLILGGIAWSIVLCVVAYNQVDFIEKHAPIINARLHSGAITDDADATYAGSKIGVDLAALEADYKGDDWSKIRPELLSRKSYLVDLKAQNDKIQGAFERERGANAGTVDSCEQLALDEFSPALQAYATAMDKVFSFAENTAVLSSENGSKLQQLGEQEMSSLKSLQKYFADSHSQSCDK